MHLTPQRLLPPPLSTTPCILKDCVLLYVCWGWWGERTPLFDLHVYTPRVCECASLRLRAQRALACVLKRRVQQGADPAPTTPRCGACGPALFSGHAALQQAGRGRPDGRRRRGRHFVVCSVDAGVFVEQVPGHTHATHTNTYGYTGYLQARMVRGCSELRLSLSRLLFLVEVLSPVRRTAKIMQKILFQEFRNDYLSQALLIANV